MGHLINDFLGFLGLIASGVAVTLIAMRVDQHLPRLHQRLNVWFSMIPRWRVVRLLVVIIWALYPWKVLVEVPRPPHRVFRKNRRTLRRAIGTGGGSARGFIFQELRQLVRAWLMVDLILIAGITEATGSLALSIAAGHRFGLWTFVSQFPLVLCSFVGTWGLARRNAKALLACAGGLALNMVFTSSVGTQPGILVFIFMWLAWIGWMTGVSGGVLAISRIGRSPLLMQASMVVAGIAMFFDLATCSVTTPAIASGLHLNWAVNEVTWWNLAPVPGQVLLGILLVTRGWRGDFPPSAMASVGSAPDGSDGGGRARDSVPRIHEVPPRSRLRPRWDVMPFPALHAI